MYLNQDFIYIFIFLKKTCSCVYLIALSHTVLLAACRSYSIHGLRKRICFSLEDKQEGIESSYYMQTRPGTFSLIIFFDAVYTSWGKNSNTGNFCTLSRRVLLNRLSSLRWMPSSHKIWSQTMAKCEWVSMYSPKKKYLLHFFSSPAALPRVKPGLAWVLKLSLWYFFLQKNHKL